MLFRSSLDLYLTAVNLLRRLSNGTQYRRAINPGRLESEEEKTGDVK